MIVQFYFFSDNLRLLAFNLSTTMTTDKYQNFF